jgi:hypothetical protein
MHSHMTLAVVVRLLVCLLLNSPTNLCQLSLKPQENRIVHCLSAPSLLLIALSVASSFMLRLMIGTGLWYAAMVAG